MKFKEDYPEQLRVHGGEMEISMGWRTEGREPALAEAVRSGRITAELASQCMPEYSERFKRIELSEAVRSGRITAELASGRMPECSDHFERLEKPKPRTLPRGEEEPRKEAAA